MTPHQIELVQKSFAQVVPIKDAAAEMFYERLFELDPGISSLFGGDMKEQGRKLMAMIATAVLICASIRLPGIVATPRRNAPKPATTAIQPMEMVVHLCA